VFTWGVLQRRYLALTRSSRFEWYMRVVCAFIFGGCVSTVIASCKIIWCRTNPHRIDALQSVAVKHLGPGLLDAGVGWEVLALRA
jgi:hypothetical protein